MTEAELVEQIRSVDVRAPESLHRSIDAMIAAKPVRGGARSGDGAARSFGLAPRLAAVGAIAAVVAALALAVGLSGGSSKLSLRDASALTLRGATAAPPAESSSKHRELTASVDGVSFPYWGEHFGWRSTGSRTDTVDGRTVTTVFYANHRGQRVGYAIVAGSAPTQTSGGVVSMRDGTPYRLLTVNGVAVVTWMRNGRLCVVSGRGVSGERLLALASWDDHRSVTS
ncbi:MAG TPA: hypothetical protein VH025_08410 [Solirubrobacteraceae bacterium]|jgi:hypothetical protein|nr:hypothetical protein [Solirubrobacteraceae bacterium]